MRQITSVKAHSRIVPNPGERYDKKIILRVNSGSSSSLMARLSEFRGGPGGPPLPNHVQILLKLCIFSFGLLDDRHAGVGMFHRGKEILIRSLPQFIRTSRIQERRGLGSIVAANFSKRAGDGN